VADETLDTIQDAVDELLDSRPEIEYEVSLANGVLTLKLPPHGTWVLNKQTPNRQIWVRTNEKKMCKVVLVLCLAFVDVAVVACAIRQTE